jgi:peptidoglycan/xylan/chitin deacetylase (PgdA/CDA1 family)
MKSGRSLQLILILSWGWSISAFPQTQFQNIVFLKALNQDSGYVRLKRKVISEFDHSKPGHWGEFVPGVDEDIRTNQKMIAFSFDACGGEKGTGFDKELIDYLKKERIPATFFITGRWIDAHFSTFLNMSQDSLFEIENHGLNHKPCSIDGESEYGIHGTSDVADAFDEVEGNARKIEAITGRKPSLYRSATAYIDEACASMASQLGITAISFQVLSGDAVPNTPISVLSENILKNAKPGAIVIMHMNHPEWNIYEALQLVVPALRRMGYTFIKLKNEKLQSRVEGKK